MEKFYGTKGLLWIIDVPQQYRVLGIIEEVVSFTSGAWTFLVGVLGITVANYDCGCFVEKSGLSETIGFPICH